MRFDWYQATLPAKPMELLGILQSELAPGGQVEEGRGRQGYYGSYTVRDRLGGRVAVVLAGGPNGEPNAAASGAATDGFVEVIRAHWPRHRVSRLDSAADVTGAGAYERIEATCREVARARGVTGRAIVPDDPAEGRTYYLGAASSAVRVRLYDKTAESRSRLPPNRRAEVPEHWVRVEAQIRPQKEAKGLCATISPVDVWGLSGWTAELAGRVLGAEVERVGQVVAKLADDDRALGWLVAQYAGPLRRLCDGLGSWEAAGEHLGAMVEHWERQRAERATDRARER